MKQFPDWMKAFHWSPLVLSGASIFVPPGLGLAVIFGGFVFDVELDWHELFVSAETVASYSFTILAVAALLDSLLVIGHRLVTGKGNAIPAIIALCVLMTFWFVKRLGQAARARPRRPGFGQVWDVGADSAAFADSTQCESSSGSIRDRAAKRQASTPATR